MLPLFTSILATEMTGYLNLVSETGKGITPVKSLFKSLDQYLMVGEPAAVSEPVELSLSLRLVSLSNHRNVEPMNIII